MSVDQLSSLSAPGFLGNHDAAGKCREQRMIAEQAIQSGQVVGHLE